LKRKNVLTLNQVSWHADDTFLFLM
jgi:hypothetical protein